LNPFLSEEQIINLCLELSFPLLTHKGKRQVVMHSKKSKWNMAETHYYQAKPRLQISDST